MKLTILKMKVLCQIIELRWAWLPITSNKDLYNLILHSLTNLIFHQFTPQETCLPQDFWMFCWYTCNTLMKCMSPSTIRSLYQGQLLVNFSLINGIKHSTPDPRTLCLSTLLYIFPCQLPLHVTLFLLE